MSRQELLNVIERKRVELIQVVLKNGLESSVTIQFSQELDKLLNEYIKFSLKSNGLSLA